MSEMFPESAGDPAATITRWHYSDWPRLVRGQRVTAWDREWRVTGVREDLSGNETYSLEPAEVVDAREARRRALREGEWDVTASSPLPDGAYWIES